MEKKTKVTVNDKGAWGQLFWVSTLGIHLVLSSAVGLLIGHYLDKLFKTKPIFLIIFFAIGIFAGFREIFREVKKINKEEDKNKTI